MTSSLQRERVLSDPGAMRLHVFGLFEKDSAFVILRYLSKADQCHASDIVAIDTKWLDACIHCLSVRSQISRFEQQLTSDE